MDSKQPSPRPSRGTRAYDASGRQAEAAARRVRVIEAARALFVEEGYAATSIAAIAKRAGVSAPTVYAQFESKAGILAQVVYTAVAGDHEDAGLARERPDVARAFAPDLPVEARIATIAGYARQAHERSAHLVALAESVAGTDEAVAALVQELHAGQRSDALAAARAFAAGSLPPELSVEQLADFLWTVAGSSTYELLIGHAGYSPDEYQAWLETMARGLLLPRPARTAKQARR